MAWDARGTPSSGTGKLCLRWGCRRPSGPCLRHKREKAKPKLHLPQQLRVPIHAREERPSVRKCDCYFRNCGPHEEGTARRRVESPKPASWCLSLQSYPSVTRVSPTLPPSAILSGRTEPPPFTGEAWQPEKRALGLPRRRREALVSAPAATSATAASTTASPAATSTTSATTAAAAGLSVALLHHLVDVLHLLITCRRHHRFGETF
jgi:hypothetical protein